MVRSDQQRVRSLLSEAITILCKNCLAYKSEFTVEGLLGITLDQDEVFLVNIKENIYESGGDQVGQTLTPGSLQAEQLLGLNQQQNFVPQPVPQRPSRVVPVSRPYPAKSPFMPKRTTFGTYRGRGRGRGRGRPPSRPNIRPPSRTVTSNSSQGEPVEKRSHLDIPTEPIQAGHTELIEIKEEDDESRTSEQIQDNGKTDSGQDTVSKSHSDALVSLDFGDMLQQYEEASSNLQGEQGEEDSEDTAPHDDSLQQDSTTQDQHHKDVLVIKPDPESGMNSMTSQSQSNSNSDNVFTSSHMDSSGGMYPGAQSGSMFPGTGPGQFMDTSMAGLSAWGQQQVPSTQSMSGYTPRSKPSTPRKSGPGRPSAAAGSPAQGGSPQFTPLRSKYRAYSISYLANAVNAVMEHGLSLRAAARQFGVPKTTLGRMLKKEYHLLLSEDEKVNHSQAKHEEDYPDFDFNNKMS